MPVLFLFERACVVWCVTCLCMEKCDDCCAAHTTRNCYHKWYWHEFNVMFSIGTPRGFGIFFINHFRIIFTDFNPNLKLFKFVSFERKWHVSCIPFDRESLSVKCLAGQLISLPFKINTVFSKHFFHFSWTHVAEQFIKSHKISIGMCKIHIDWKIRFELISFGVKCITAFYYYYRNKQHLPSKLQNNVFRFESDHFGSTCLLIKLKVFA